MGGRNERIINERMYICKPVNDTMITRIHCARTKLPEGFIDFKESNVFHFQIVFLEQITLGLDGCHGPVH